MEPLAGRVAPQIDAKWASIDHEGFAIARARRVGENSGCHRGGLPRTLNPLFSAFPGDFSLFTAHYGHDANKLNTPLHPYHPFHPSP